jgi:NADH:ubiquinone oxidoreductase subunit K
VTSLVLSAALIGLYGVLTRRQIVAVLASVEVMLGGSTLLLVSYGAGLANPAAAQGYALIVLVVIAAEAAVGLALLVTLVRHGLSRTDEITEVRG